MKLRPLLLSCLVACGAPDPGVDLPAPRVVPRPVLVEDGVGSYAFGEQTAIVAPGDAAPVGTLLAEALRPSTGLPLPVVADGDGVVLVLDPTLPLPAEGYRLDVDPGGVVIAAADADGLFHGTQTLRQLLPPRMLGADRVGGEVRVPVVHVEDAPRFAWRGFMLDVARHFFPVEDVERQIDLLALHHGNRLHLHLTDDQGWRIEIASWPDLARVGGATQVGGGRGGFYTQEEFRGLVAYAAARHVTLVPEVDVPGHTIAAMSAYGELSRDGIAPPPYTRTGVPGSSLDVFAPAAAELVADVFREVAAMTPGPWLHVGADEVSDVDVEDYADFVVAVQDVVTAEGKTLIGWDEIGVARDLAPPYVAQHWIDAGRARTAAGRGAQVIASPAQHAYLDMVHDPDATFGQLWAGPTDVQKAYDWEPVDPELDESDVLGVEGALWTEFVDSRVRLDLMAWPRLAAIAEVGWSPADRTWDDFRDRLGWHGRRLDALGVGFYRSTQVDWSTAD